MKSARRAPPSSLIVETVRDMTDAELAELLEIAANTADEPGAVNDVVIAAMREAAKRLEWSQASLRKPDAPR